jgi:hypothetical protein
MTSDREIPKNNFFRQWANPAFHFYVRRTRTILRKLLDMTTIVTPF